MPANTVIIPLKAIYTGSDVTALGELAVGDRLDPTYVGTSQYLEVANNTTLLATKASWTALTATNTAIRTLVTTETGRVTLVNTNLTATNTAIRTLVSDRMQVANTIALANARLGKSSTVTLTGDITASATAFSANAVSLATTLSSTGVTAASYGSAALIPVFTVDAKGRITTATTASVAGVTSVTYYSANSTLRIATADGTNFDTSISTNDKLEVANATILFNDRMQVANTTLLVNDRLQVANATTLFATKAPLASPALTGVPTAPTAANTVSTTQVATTAFVQNVVDVDVAALVASAPATLNTLNELADALGDDANFATTLTTNLGQKLGASASVTLTGAVTGTASFSANAVSVTTVATADPTITLAGDLSGAVTLTNLGNGTLTATVADDSHNHTISNVDGLQTDLDTRATWSGLTSTNTAIRTLVTTETGRVGLLNTNLTATNTAIRTLVSDRMQVANTTLLVNDRMQVANVTTLLATKLSSTGGTISGHLIPSANTTYDLGSSTKAFRDIYLSGNTITLGTVKLEDGAASLVVRDTTTNNVVKLSASAGLVINGKTVIDSDGELDVSQTGQGYTTSTIFVFPTGNYDGSDAYVGETSATVDAFSVALGTTFTCMEPVGSTTMVDLGTL
jgi:molybdenum-dependent DNA-binding transcriptional regulator ModE